MTTSLPDEGEQIFVIGNPLRLEGSVSDGIVSAIREVPDLGRIIQITAPVSHGNSGSPLFNMRGEVIGIVTVKVTNGQNINLALGVARINSLLKGQLISFDQIAARSRSVTQPELLAELWYRGGIDSLWLGNYDSALNYFETAANRNPRRPETWIQIGYCKVKQGRNEEAIRAYKRALQLRPSSSEAYNKLGDAYFFAGRFDDAITSYKEAARVQPNEPEAYYNLGLAYLEIGDRESAMVQARRLESIDAELNMSANAGLAIQCVGIVLLTLLSLSMRGSIKSVSLTYWTRAWASLSLALISLFVGCHVALGHELFYSLYFFGEYAFGLMFVGGCRFLANNVSMTRRCYSLLIPAAIIAGVLPFLSNDFNNLFMVQATIMAWSFASTFLVFVSTIKPYKAL